jgi:hypothetical protein
MWRCDVPVFGVDVGMALGLSSLTEGHSGTDARSCTDAAAPLLAPPGRGATLLDRMLRADRLSEHHRGEQDGEDW